MDLKIMENLIQPVFFEKRFTNKSSTVVLEDVGEYLLNAVLQM